MATPGGTIVISSTKGALVLDAIPERLSGPTYRIDLVGTKAVPAFYPRD